MIHVVTDTVAGLPPEVTRAYPIRVVSQVVIFGEQSLRDMEDISPSEFYARLATSAEMPHSSAPSIGDFTQVYSDILQDDPEATILSIHPSSDVSGTVRSAEMAIASMAADIRLFDTRSASLGMGLMALQAARMARDGRPADDIMACLAEMRDGMHVYFLVRTLDYLAKGGRIGRASHLLGTLLDVKPLLALRGGVVEDAGRYRTHRRAVEALTQIVIQDARGQPGLQLAVVHAADVPEAQALADGLCAELQPEVFLVGEICPAIGVHVGPGALGVCYYAPHGG